MTAYKEMVDLWLASRFDGKDTLSDSMRYSLNLPGKRIRPVLTLEWCRICKGDTEKALPVAGAVEMLHCYSLIHDDLPCMDNDDMRRGFPSNHIRYGVTVATLAGDCMQAEAFASLAGAELPSENVKDCISYLTEAAGIRGICLGQQLDLAGDADEKQLLFIDSKKTAALIAAACAMGACAAGADREKQKAAFRFGENIGMAFQLTDDILDGDGLCALMGKESCMEQSKNYTDKALQELSAFEDTDELKTFVLSLLNRKT